MKKGIATQLCGLILLLAMAAIFLPRTALAATYEVESEKSYTVTSGDYLKITLSSQKDVAVIGDETLEIWYGNSSAADSYKLDLTQGAAIVTLDGRTWYFRVKSGRGTISFTWGEANDTPARATEFSLEQGESRSFDQEPRFRYFLLNVTDSSAKYTFTADNSSTDIGIIPGKVTTESWHVDDDDYRIPDGGSKTFVLTKGYYTFCGTAFSQNVQLTVKREKWIGITKITPDNDGKIVGVAGTKFDYKVYYEPKNADSKISVKSVSPAANTHMTLKSQSNGVAVFEVNFPFDEEKKEYTSIYKNNETSRNYNRVQFTSEEGISAIAEKMAGPMAPELWKTMSGTTTTITIPVNGSGNKYVAYVKSGNKWKKCATTTASDNGVYYLNCQNLKAGKTYTFRVYAYSDGVKGGYLQVKGVTAYNIKPTNAKATCTKAKFVKQSGKYDWFWTGYMWKKVEYSDYTSLTIKVTYKLPKEAKGTYVTVNGVKRKSGSKFTTSVTGKSKAGTKGTVILQSVREVGNCLAYGPSVKVTYKMKAAK